VVAAVVPIADPGYPLRPTRAPARRYGATQVLITTSAMVAALFLTVVVYLAVLGRLQHHAAQTREFARLREELASGVAPVGPTDQHGHLLPLGTPVALISIPHIHVTEVVLEGTTSGVLMSGPGHLRTTVFPGQQGTSVIFGRRAAFGGPFANLDRLRTGDLIVATTGVGATKFKVVDKRRSGDPVPGPPQNGARLTLVTATGPRLVPTGVLRVDADNVGTAQPAAALAVSSVPHSELALGTDTGSLWGLVLVLQALVVLAVGSVYAWYRWGVIRTWVLFLPPLLLAVYFLCGGVARLLPNLL
jgi:sortase A